MIISETVDRHTRAVPNFKKWPCSVSPRQRCVPFDLRMKFSILNKHRNIGFPRHTFPKQFDPRGFRYSVFNRQTFNRIGGRARVPFENRCRARILRFWNANPVRRVLSITLSPPFNFDVRTESWRFAVVEFCAVRFPRVIVFQRHSRGERAEINSNTQRYILVGKANRLPVIHTISYSYN